MKIKNKITDDIADTLYITLIMKCKETHRKNAFFHDPVACDLVGKIDYDFSKYEKVIRSSVGTAIRARYFDQITKEFIENNTNTVIVHLGCGLDSRFQRIGKPVMDKTVFYEIDLPEVMELRKELIPESKNNPYIAASMFETRWMDNLKAKHPDSKFLFIVEGVFMYFNNGEVKSVIQNMASRFGNSMLVFDAVSSWMCKNSYRHDAVKLSKATFKFACDDSRLLEQWNSKLKFVSVKYYNNFKAWRKAGFVNWLGMNMIPTFSKASRMLIYRIEN